VRLETVSALLRVVNAASTRYAFRSPEKVALQEIGPRFTLKLKWMKKGIPAMSNFGEAPLPLESRSNAPPADPGIASLETISNEQTAKIEIASTKQDEVLWAWKVSFSCRSSECV
jgi:ribosome production factor 1